MLDTNRYKLQCFDSDSFGYQGFAWEKLIQKNLELIGPPQFTAEEQKFAKALQKSFNAEEKGMSTGIEKLELSEIGIGRGSVDVADISWVTPVARFGVATTAPGIRGHSWGIVACSGGDVGHKGLIVATKTIALSVYELLINNELLKKMKEEWKEETKDFTYKCAVPNNIEPPVLPEPE